MKQIKTIRRRLDDNTEFDEAVNDALKEGWQLTKREVLQPRAQGPITYSNIMLYAELEREAVTEEERCCENCRHFDKQSIDEPCINCSNDCSLWENADGCYCAE